MKYIFGLGNPGPAYELTRHNVGFLFLDYFLEEYDHSLIHDNINFKSFLIKNSNVEYTVVYPLKFMNLSGQIIRYFVNEYHIPQNDFIVIYDDFHLPFGKIRLRPKGSHAGHNGIRNTIEMLDSNEFNRLRIGIGEPTKNIIDYVLGNFTNQNLEELPSIFDVCKNAIEEWSHNTFKDAMDKFNGLSII